MSEDKLIAFIKDVASAIGTARVEFEKGSREAARGISSSGTAQVGQKKDTSSDYLLIETANKMGINTEGKTREEISNLIVEKIQSKTTLTKTP